MTERPIGDALSKPIVIPDIPKDTITLAVEAEQGDAGATLTAHKDIGKPGGWETGAQVGWWKSTGAKIRAWLTWKK